MTYWFLVRDSYGISWLGDYVENMKKGLEENGERVLFVTREEILEKKSQMKSGDVCIVTDFDDMDLVPKIPEGVIKVSHGHGVALSWIANNWEGEIDREKFFYENMDIVTLNTSSQKRLIEKEQSTKCKLSVIGYPIDYDRIVERAGYWFRPKSARKRILVAQRWDWDAQQELCMEILEPFIKDSNYEVVVMTPTHRDYAEATVGKDTIEKWQKGCELEFECSQEMFWGEAQMADVFLTTGNHHTLNLSLVEAYLFGCEIVMPKKYPYTDYVRRGWGYKPYDIEEARSMIAIASRCKGVSEIDLNRFDYRNVAKNLIEAVRSL